MSSARLLSSDGRGRGQGWGQGQGAGSFCPRGSLSLRGALKPPAGPRLPAPPGSAGRLRPRCPSPAGSRGLSESLVVCLAETLGDLVSCRETSVPFRKRSADAAVGPALCARVGVGRGGGAPVPRLRGPRLWGGRVEGNSAAPQPAPRAWCAGRGAAVCLPARLAPTLHTRPRAGQAAGVSLEPCRDAACR